MKEARKKSARQERPASVAHGLPDFARSLPMMLLRARESVMRHFRASLRRNGLTEQQWRVLRALSSVREIEVSELAHVTFLLAPSLSRILPDLERRSLVKRRTDAADLRKGLVALSDEGRAVIERVSPQSEAIYEMIADRFGAANLDRLEELLLALEDGMADKPHRRR